MADNVQTKILSVAIVVPSYGRTDLLTRTLDSIAEASWPPGFTTVCIVENGPASGVKSLVNTYTTRLPVRYFNEPLLGVSAARNAGLAQCGEDIIIFFDNDVILERDSLLAYRQAFDEHGLTSFYGGPVLPDYVTPPLQWLRSFLPPSAIGFDLGKDNRWIDEPLCLGANMAYPRRWLVTSGGFDAIGATGTRGGVGEETRLQHRLFKAGYDGRYVGKARVWHYIPSENCSPKWTLRRAYRHGLTESLEARRQGRKAGVQRWMIRQVVTLELQCLLDRIRGQSLEQRFSTERNRSYFRGVVAGCYNRTSNSAKT